MVEIIKIKYQKQFKNENTINAGAMWRIPIPESAINTHKFFNDLTITNTSSSNISVVPDNDTERSFFVPGNSEKNWSFKNDNMKFSALHIQEETGADILAKKLQIIIMKKRKEDTQGGM